ncbi:MAG: hypothetical protein QXO32_08335 [Candidatus Bathyarchaeia archaeon]
MRRHPSEKWLSEAWKLGFSHGEVGEKLFIYVVGWKVGGKG